MPDRLTLVDLLMLIGTAVNLFSMAVFQFSIDMFLPGVVATISIGMLIIWIGTLPMTGESWKSSLLAGLVTASVTTTLLMSILIPNSFLFVLFGSILTTGVGVIGYRLTHK